MPLKKRSLTEVDVEDGSNVPEVPKRFQVCSIQQRRTSVVNKKKPDSSSGGIAIMIVFI